MNEENNYLNILLPVNDLYLMYKKIGDSLITRIDVDSYICTSLARTNSFYLLKAIGIISNNNQKNEKNNNIDINWFSKTLLDYLYEYFEKEISSTICGKQRIDTDRVQIFISRNDIPLRYAGLFMLLDDLKEIEIINDKVLLIGNRIIKIVTNQDTLKRVTLTQLEESLKKKKEIGEEAEQFVLNYEMNRLRKNAITLLPIQVSSIDVSAGFDILSYNSNDIIDKRFIEVKSCDSDCVFYLSSNEIETAKNKEYNYYLYLFNRIDNSITIIQNPYHIFFKECDNRWALEPNNYKIHRIM